MATKTKIMPVALAMSLMVHAAIVLCVTIVPGKSALPAPEYRQVQLIEEKIGKVAVGEEGGSSAPAPRQEVRRNENRNERSVRKERASKKELKVAQQEPPAPPQENAPMSVPQENKPETLISSVPSVPQPPSETTRPEPQPASGNSEGSSDANTPGGGTRGNGDGDGDGARAQDWRKAYKSKVLGEIRRAKRYPYAARKEGMEGRVVVKFTVMRSGELGSVSVVTPSEFSVLNSDAPDWIRRAAPFPPFPADADESSMSFTYGLKYILKD